MTRFPGQLAVATHGELLHFCRPQINVHLIRSGEAPRGIGETRATATPPALGTALFATAGPD
jgi:CO/xanthine dehydrogenase Mo-binding subunit